MKILYVVNEASFFLSHRLPLAEEAKKRGYRIIIACGSQTGEQALEAAGLEWRSFPLSRSGFSPRQEIQTMAALARIYRDEKPDIIHHVTIKPVIYGTLLARWSRVPAVVNAVPGLGFIFTRKGITSVLRQWLVLLVYRLALRHPNMRVIVQNKEDLEIFLKWGIVPRSNIVLIRGSGVDLTHFSVKAESSGPPTFVLVGRMLRHKGVEEYVRAARIVKSVHPDWQFQLVGKVDRGNPSSIEQRQLEKWTADGDVNWIGQSSDVAGVMNRAHVVVLPSYREGLPKTLLEASACGKAMIASDIAGCREVVTEGVTGMLVPVRSDKPLADAMIRLGNDKILRGRMGKSARAKAEAVFSVEDVVRSTFLVYSILLEQ